LVNSEKGDLLADSHNIFIGWKNSFCQLLNVLRVSDSRQVEIHAAEPLVSGHSAYEVEIVITKLINYISPDTEQTPGGLVQAESKQIRSEIHELINSL
jgi:hypothetical protein